MIPTSIDGTDITGATIDGTDVTEITLDGDTVFTAAPPLPSGTILHVDANQESLSNNASVSQISDFSGSGNDLTANSGTANFETNVRNGRPAYDFDGTSAYYDNSMGLSRPWTAVMALQIGSTDGDGFYSGTLADSNRSGVKTDNGEYDLYENAAGQFESGTVTTNWQIISIQCISSGTIIRKNGSVIITASSNSNAWSGGLRLGDLYNLTAAFSGYYGEIIHSTNDLGSTGELSITENDMAARWNITL